VKRLAIRKKRRAPSCSTCEINGTFCFLPVNTTANSNDAQATCSAAGGKLPFFATVADWTTFSNYRSEQLVYTANM